MKHGKKRGVRSGSGKGAGSASGAGRRPEDRTRIKVIDTAGPGRPERELVNPLPGPQGHRPTPSPTPSPTPKPRVDEDPTILVHEEPTPHGDVVGVLVAIEGELKGQIFPLASGVNEIGRLETSHVRLSSMKISRQHAQVIHSDGHFVIKALNEKNPTYLNDEATRGDALNDGDLIRLGHTTLKFRTV